MSGRPTCINIGCDNPCAHTGTRWRPYCSRCHRASYGAATYAEGVTPVKKTYCENEDGRLGFDCTTTIHGTHVLELDHIDGNHLNNKPENIMTLCTTCHKHKGYISGDFRRQGGRYEHTRPGR